MDYEIKYDNFFEFMELKNIIASKRIILKKNNASLYSYFNQFYELLFAFILFYISYSLSFIVFLRYIFLLFSMISLAMILSFLILFLIFIIQFKTYKNGRSGKMTFSNRGIVDYSDRGYICGFSWKKVRLVIVGKKSVVIFSKYPFCLFVNAKNSREVVDNVRKYANDVMIVYRKK